ncbi:protein singles bar [Culicoides brevitarsis]|uniref:protein singles bar n=1 Tax=Culicoides brevitarsis TaxID=469753 RepID=UPI00307C78AD
MPSTVIRMPNNYNSRGGQGNFGSGGIEICCGCRVCQCVHLEFLTSQAGLLKLFEVVLGSFCQTLLVQFGMSSASDIGQAFHGFLTTASACVMTSTILLICYVLSEKTYHLVRQSLFELAFNLAACFLYLSASSYMGFAVNVWLYPKYLLHTANHAYPAMTAVYYIGSIVGIVHGLDAFLSFRAFRGYG